jgi:hypothetical protein
MLDGMTIRRLLTLALLGAGLSAGCGDEIDRANDAIDRTQERVDRAKTVVEDPAKAAEREADKALEDAISPENQP